MVRCSLNPNNHTCYTCAFLECVVNEEHDNYVLRDICLVNIDNSRGVRILCPLYLEHKYTEDDDIMRIVRENYNVNKVETRVGKDGDHTDQLSSDEPHPF